MTSKEIDVADLQQDLEAIVNSLAPGDSIIVTKDGQPHARLEPIRTRIRYGALAEYAVPDADITDMDPEIEAMFEGREFTMIDERSKTE